ncbi:hypothetical protein ElyMa_005327700 [Elysia marginata]|uniref:Uncharacterized protein n=1 Tax=Elysia marginata TaxID=1093978 RepID=A0AAV4JZ75_9GAST|nr:hypothetical protein ElyMa_005327700 [Elysia marginata]
MHILPLLLFPVFTIQGPGCYRLFKCIHDYEFGTNGTYSFTSLNETPANLSAWEDVYENICDTREQRKCSVSNCSRDWILWKWNFVKRNADSMCDDNGYHYHRLFQSASHCISNASLFAEGKRRREYCETRFNYYGIRKRPASNRCEKLNKTRNCANEYFEDECGDIGKFIMDTMWFNRFKVYDNPCWRSLWSTKCHMTRPGTQCEYGTPRPS